MNREIKTPLTKEMAKKLRAGDYVTITGTIYTARDAAHKRMIEALDAGEKLPIEIDGNILYYMDLPRPEKAVRLVPPVQQRPAVWISTRHGCWILA